MPYRVLVPRNNSVILTRRLRFDNVAPKNAQSRCNRLQTLAIVTACAVAVAIFCGGCASRVRPIQNAVPSTRCCSSGVCEAQGHHRLGVPKVSSVGDVQPTYLNDKGGK